MTTEPVPGWLAAEGAIDAADYAEMAAERARVEEEYREHRHRMISALEDQARLLVHDVAAVLPEDDDSLGIDFEWARLEDAHQEPRRRIISALEDQARLLPHTVAVIPEDNDPLESMDPTPESDLDFPVSRADWYATYHFEHFLEWVFEN
jgi:hypothetical protein